MLVLVNWEAVDCGCQVAVHINDSGGCLPLLQSVRYRFIHEHARLNSVTWEKASD